MPFADGTFDVATNCISCHFYLDQVQAFREIHRVLSPGGRFYCAAMSTRRRARPLFAGMAVYYPPVQLEAHLRQAGFVVCARERLFPAVVIFEAKKASRAPP
jgi:ubiquinone/menaquinone biosynthesis C-methylase UbiE